MMPNLGLLTHLELVFSLVEVREISLRFPLNPFRTIDYYNEPETNLSNIANVPTLIFYNIYFIKVTVQDDPRNHVYQFFR